MEKLLNKAISTPLAIGIILFLSVLLGGYLEIREEIFTKLLETQKANTQDTSIEEFTGRVRWEILSIDMRVPTAPIVDEVLLLKTSIATYSLIGSKAEELKSTIGSLASPPWDIKIFGCKKGLVQIYGENIFQIDVEKYEGLDRGWAEGIIHLFSDCSFGKCIEKLSLNAEGGGKYEIEGNLVEELFSILDKEGEYNENSSMKRLKIKIYGELGRVIVGGQKTGLPTIRVEKYQY